MPQVPVGEQQARLGSQELWRTAPLEALLRFDVATYLEELLMKQDTMSMAASLESRVPFLDNDLVAWASKVPAQFKLSHMRGKVLVRRAASRWLPDEVIHGKKRGFSVPLARWFRRGPGLEMLRDVAIDRHDPHLDATFVKELVDQHQLGRDHTDRLWRILAFQVWRRSVVPRMTTRGVA
jgi:asparagine synthase (glutamine-hydrolysing)